MPRITPKTPDTAALNVALADSSAPALPSCEKRMIEEAINDRTARASTASIVLRMFNLQKGNERLGTSGGCHPERTRPRCFASDASRPAHERPGANDQQRHDELSQNDRKSDDFKFPPASPRSAIDH